MGIEMCSEKALLIDFRPLDMLSRDTWNSDNFNSRRLQEPLRAYLICSDKNSF